MELNRGGDTSTVDSPLACDGTDCPKTPGSGELILHQAQVSDVNGQVDRWLNGTYSDGLRKACSLSSAKRDSIVLILRSSAAYKLLKSRYINEQTRMRY